MISIAFSFADNEEKNLGHTPEGKASLAACSYTIEGHPAA